MFGQKEKIKVLLSLWILKLRNVKRQENEQKKWKTAF